MTPGDTARVLAKAAAFDQRTIGEADVRAWHEVLSDLHPADALAAVTEHYTETDQRIMPVHVRRRAITIGAERLRLERAEDERRQLAAYAATAGPLRDRSDNVRALVDQLRSILPEGNPEVLRPRAAYWAREHHAYRRQQDAEPNPFYDPTQARPDA